MAQNCKEKTCVDCGAVFKPTSNVQKRCPACMKQKSKAAVPAHARAARPVRLPVHGPAVHKGPLNHANAWALVENIITAVDADRITIQRGAIVATFTKER